MDTQEIKLMLYKQLNNFYILDDIDKKIIEKNFDYSINRTLNCFSNIKNKYYNNCINYLHTQQYIIFLYYLSRTIFENDNYILTCDKIYNLIKIIGCLDLYYQVQLPTFFYCDHPFGSVIGRGSYGDGFCFSQGCTVGNNNGVYPKFGKYVMMCSNSKILGKSIIGDYVIISANTYLKDFNVPSYSLVFGQMPNIIVKEYSFDKIKRYFQNIFVFK